MLLMQILHVSMQKYLIILSYLVIYRYYYYIYKRYIEIDIKIE